MMTDHFADFEWEARLESVRPRTKRTSRIRIVLSNEQGGRKKGAGNRFMVAEGAAAPESPH